jgi:hypothetical protein
MKTLLITLAASALVLATSGCVVAPAPPGAVEGGVYVAPTYASPGPGYLWERHPRYGWGWHHPERGWDRGWR